VIASCLLAERRTVIRRLDASYPTIMALCSLVIEPQAALVEGALNVNLAQSSSTYRYALRGRGKPIPPVQSARAFPGRQAQLHLHERAIHPDQRAWKVPVPTLP